MSVQGLSRLAGHSLAMALTAWFILWAVRGGGWLRWGLCLPLGLLWQGFLLSAMGFAMQHEVRGTLLVPLASIPLSPPCPLHATPWASFLVGNL
eukprot:COSAG01_NODE_4591_length_4892_cov_69.289589_3_plen_94_part_00